VPKVITSIEIEASPEKVFAFAISEKMNDVWKEWLETKWTSKEPVGVGSIAHFIGKGGGYENLEYDMEVTEYVKDKKMAMRTLGKSKLNATSTMTLEPTNKGTKMTYSVDYKPPYSVLGKLVAKLKVSKEIEKNDKKFLENMKKAIEPNKKN
jgi:carbon monoxide dehydrogenase subunit G